MYREFPRTRPLTSRIAGETSLRFEANHIMDRSPGAWWIVLKNMGWMNRSMPDTRIECENHQDFRPRGVFGYRIIRFLLPVSGNAPGSTMRHPEES